MITFVVVRRPDSIVLIVFVFAVPGKVDEEITRKVDVEGVAAGLNVVATLFEVMVVVRRPDSLVLIVFVLAVSLKVDVDAEAARVKVVGIFVGVIAVVVRCPDSLVFIV